MTAGDIVDVAGAAAILGVNVQTARRLVRDGRLKGVKLGAGYAIAREDLNAFQREYQGRRGPKTWGRAGA